MRQFQILVIAHCLKGNKIAKSGETVSENQLTSPADELITAGFIKEVFKDVNDIKTVEAKQVVSNDVKKDIKNTVKKA